MAPQTQPAGLPAYDPSNPTPYTAPPPLPEITAPPTRPAQETQQPTTAPTGPQVARSGGGLATAAFGLDSILKGYMRGREQAQQVRAYKAKQLSDGLRYAYETSAQQYLALLQAGKDPKDPEVVKADNAQRAAYQSLMQMQNNYINQSQGKQKKSKGGGQSSGSGGQPENPLEMMASQDPQVKLRGIALLQQKTFEKIGTPANAIGMQLSSPEYQAQRKLYQGQQANAATEQQIQTNKDALLKELTDLDKLPSLNPEQQKRQAELRENPVLFQGAARVPRYSPNSIPGASLKGKNDIFGNPTDPANSYREVTRATGEVGYEPETAKPTAVKPPNRDDNYIRILEKQQKGEHLDDDDKAYLAAYDLYVKRTKTDPGVARAAAFGANRYVPILDPADPENVTYMRVGEAAQAGAHTPQSLSFQIDKAVTKAFTSGKPAENVNYFNTAIDHLKLLQQASDALENHDTQLFNKVGNSWATATGESAPTDFNAVRNAVAGELAKTFSGGRATKEEISLMNETINNTQSPKQLADVTSYYTKLMDGKLHALEQQYEQGKHGKPAFENKTGDGTHGSAAAPHAVDSILDQIFIKPKPQ